MFYATDGLLDMVSRKNQEEKSNINVADLDKEGPINLELYDFNLLMTLAGTN